MLIGHNTIFHIKQIKRAIIKAIHRPDSTTTEWNENFFILVNILEITICDLDDIPFHMPVLLRWVN